MLSQYGGGGPKGKTQVQVKITKMSYIPDIMSQRNLMQKQGPSMQKNWRVTRKALKAQVIGTRETDKGNTAVSEISSFTIPYLTIQWFLSLSGKENNALGHYSAHFLCAGNKPPSCNLCCDVLLFSYLHYTTDPAFPADLAPLVSQPRAQCIMVFIAWLVTISCTLFFIMQNSLQIQIYFC